MLDTLIFSEYPLSMNFQTSIKTCFNKYSVFSGRASRSEFWFFYLFVLIGYIACFVLMMAISFKLLWLFIIFVLLIFVPTLSVTARRLHDINKSGWFLLLPLPASILETIFAASSESLEILFLVIGLGLYVYLFILYCRDGDKKNNRFGKNIYKKRKKSR